MNTFGFSRRGGYECSSKGDRRFSAFYAVLPDGRTIEQAYQLDVKGYRKFGNSPMLGKGKPPLAPMTAEEIWNAYLALWRTWAAANPALMRELRTLAAQHNNLLSDMFATTPVNQARALATLLNELP